MKFVNKPLSNYDLINWCKYLGIFITGIYSRDEHMPQNHSPCIINLDQLKSSGTHWVGCVPGNEIQTLWYFDSYGIWYPHEYYLSVKKHGITNIIFNTAQYQTIDSFLCGYYILYFIREAQLFNKDYFNILQPLSITDVEQNEIFIKNYFKNI